MPLPTSGEQESLKSNLEPSLKPGMDVVPAVPRNPRKFSKLVLLTTSKDSTKVAGAKRKGVHCVMSLGAPGPATLARALLKTHPEAERAIEAAPQEPEAKHSKLDLDADGKEDSGLAGAAPVGHGEDSAAVPSVSL